MGLVYPNGDTAVELLCHCMGEFASHSDFYAHVGDCPIPRCAYCLTVLGDPPYEQRESHMCPRIKVEIMKWQNDG